MNAKQSLFTRFAKETSRLAGRPTTFIVAALIIVVWALSGSYFGYSDTWQLVINTGTTIVTFLMVFLIQATQNRDTEALHLKLDEIIRAMKGARNSFINLEELDEEELLKLHEEYSRLADEARRAAGKGLGETDRGRIGAAE